MTVIKEIKGIEMPGGIYKTTCVDCGKPISLYEVGEWDGCCGLVYNLEAPTVNFVVIKGDRRN